MSSRLQFLLCMVGCLAGAFLGCSGGESTSAPAGSPAVDVAQLPPNMQINEYASRGDVAQVKALIESDAKLVNARDGGRRTPLHWAALNGNKSLVTTLLELGANPEAMDSTGQTPSMAAVENMHQDIRKIIDEAVTQKAQQKTQPKAQ